MTENRALELALVMLEEAVNGAKNKYFPKYLDDWEMTIFAIKEVLENSKGK